MKSVRNMFTVFITCALLISDSHLADAKVLPSTELAYQPFIEHQAVAVNPYENIEQAEYHIIYELNGGENAENNSDTVLESEFPFTLGIPEREGYNFAGWYTDSHFTNKITKITCANATDMVLFAKWTAPIDNYRNVEMYSYHTTSLFTINQKELKQCDYSFMDNLNIPGMPATRELDYFENYINSADLCMQGLCFTPEYILMTAYTEDKNEQGSLMVFDRMSGAYLASIGMKNDSHLGGITFDGDNIWICHSNTNTLERIPYSYIATIAEKRDGLFVDASEVLDEYHIRNTPSCITYYGGRIWVASYTKMFHSKMYSYAYDAQNDALIALAGYNIPCKVQGVAFDDDGSVYLSTSLGRNKSSFLRGYTSLIALNKNPDQPEVKVEMPPCSEEIAIADSNIYVLFESASPKYFEGTDGNGTSIAPIDKILEVTVASIW